MPDVFLVPEIQVEADGESAAIDLGGDAGKAFFAALAITSIAEQQSLDVSIWGSADGSEWSAKPLAAFPQKFYTGVFEIVVDLSATPEIKCVKAKWHVNRWGVGDLKSRVSFLVKLQAVKTALA